MSTAENDSILPNGWYRKEQNKSESAAPALGFYFSILLNHLFLCWDPLQQCKQTLWAEPSKLTWDWGKIAAKLGQGFTYVFGRNSVGVKTFFFKLKKLNFFFLHKHGYFVTMSMIGIFHISNWLSGEEKIQLIKIFQVEMSTSSECHWGRLGTEMASILSNSRVRGNRNLQYLWSHLTSFPAPGQD